MSIILIIAIIWGASALVRASKEAKRQRELEKQRREAAARSAEMQRMREEWKQRMEESKLETARLIALEREQMRQAREQEKLAKEQEKQAAQLAKHEKRLADLEERMAVAEGEIEFQAQQIERLREHIEHAETERDACVYGSSRYYQWDKKCLALEKQIHTAESKMAKAQYIKTSAAKELAA